MQSHPTLGAPLDLVVGLVAVAEASCAGSLELVLFTSVEIGFFDLQVLFELLSIFQEIDDTIIFDALLFDVFLPEIVEVV